MKAEVFPFENNNYIIFVGLNKYENDKILEEANKNDMWFHIQDQPSCHVLLKNIPEGKRIPKQVIKKCAYLCKINSNAKYNKSKSDVVYTRIYNILKTNKIGQVSIKDIYLCKFVDV